MNEERKYNINERRINRNKVKITESKNRKLKYRLVQCSIAAAALFASSCSGVLYKSAPVDGAILYTIGENTTQIIKGNRPLLNQPLEVVDGRYITEEGINKMYETPAIKDDGDTYQRKMVRVPLYSIVSKTNGNNLIVTDKVEVESGTYIYVKTVPSRGETIRDTAVGWIAAIAGMSGFAFYDYLIYGEEAYEENLKAENRKKIKENKKVMRMGSN